MITSRHRPQDLHRHRVGVAAAGGDEEGAGQFDAAHLIGGLPPAPVRAFDAALDAASGRQRRRGQDGAWSDRSAMRVAEQLDDPVVAGEVGQHIGVPVDKDVAASGERDADRPVGDGQVECERTKSRLVGSTMAAISIASANFYVYLAVIPAVIHDH